MSHRATIKPLVLILIHFYFKNLYVLKKCRYEIFCFIAFSRHKPANGRLSKIRSENIPQSIVSCFVKSFIPLNFAENDFPQANPVSSDILVMRRSLDQNIDKGSSSVM